MKTRKIVLLSLSVLAMALIFWAPIAWAGDQPISPAAPTAPTAPEAAAQHQMVQGQATVQGTIIAEKNKNGAIIGYAIQEAGGQSAMLSKEGQGMELRKMVGKKVEAVGTLEEVYGKTTITVNEFKEIK